MGLLYTNAYCIKPQPLSKKHPQPYLSHIRRLGSVAAVPTLRICHEGMFEEDSSFGIGDNKSNYNTTLSSDVSFSSYPYKLEEMELLSELCNGDEAVPKLKELWFSEHNGPPRTTSSSRTTETTSTVEKLLKEASLCIGNPTQWNKSEEMLIQLINEYPSFIEPYVRLSKLYCLQQKFDTSKQLALQVLEMKPWHFVALQTMVTVAYATNDTSAYFMWQQRKLPPYNQLRERQEWVERALSDFSALMSKQEQNKRYFD